MKARVECGLASFDRAPCPPWTLSACAAASAWLFLECFLVLASSSRDVVCAFDGVVPFLVQARPVINATIYCWMLELLEAWLAAALMLVTAGLDLAGWGH